MIAKLKSFHLGSSETEVARFPMEVRKAHAVAQRFRHRGGSLRLPVALRQPVRVAEGGAI